METVTKPDIVHANAGWNDVWDIFFAKLRGPERQAHIEWVLSQMHWSAENYDHDEARKAIRDLLTTDDSWFHHTVCTLVGVADWEPTERFSQRITYYLKDKLGREPSADMEAGICSLTAGITNWIATTRYNDRASQTG